MRKTGTYQKLGDLNYFIPYSLPPINPVLEMSPEVVSLYGEANYALGQLNQMSQSFLYPKQFIKAYVMKEALLSSDIEGIHTTLVEVLTTVVGSSKPSKDTQLVLNYIKALDEAKTMLEQDGLPLTIRIILKAHEVLMSSNQGGISSPGVFRKQSVRVGEFTPPPATEIANLMSNLEKYINEPSEMPPLIKAGLAHVHFETIHPFLDGNGRIGRLLIVLMLLNSKLLVSSILYPSYYFKKYRLEYYQKLDLVRTHGDFEGWIIYYLKAIKMSAIDAYMRAQEIEGLELQLIHSIKSEPAFAKMRETAICVLRILFNYPITNISEISQESGKAYNTIHNVLKKLEVYNIVFEVISHKRNRVYHFKPYLNLLEKEYQDF